MATSRKFKITVATLWGIVILDRILNWLVEKYFNWRERHDRKAAREIKND